MSADGFDFLSAEDILAFGVARGADAERRALIGELRALQAAGADEEEIAAVGEELDATLGRAIARSKADAVATAARGRSTGAG